MERADDWSDRELVAEREYMASCRSALNRMRNDANKALDDGQGEGDAVNDKVANHALRRLRKEQTVNLSISAEVPLFFGRLECDTDSSPLRAEETSKHGLVYVGRRGVRDEQGRHMVIDWRTPLAATFYEANGLEPKGMLTRRRYGFDDESTITAYEDEPLDQSDRKARGNDLLTAQIERPRVGPMRDIVATIQPEQMALVQALSDKTMCIQGAPGTGKTAVGLHRLAYLLYRDRERLQKRGGVAVIGPNRSFLSYISNVLPALGEVAITQTTITDLLGSRLRPDGTQGSLNGHDAHSQAQVSGDARMAEVIKRMVWSRVDKPADPLEIRFRHHRLVIMPEDIDTEINMIRSRGLSYRAGSDMLHKRLSRLLLRQLEQARGLTPSNALDMLQRNRDLHRAVRHIWPPLDPPRLIFTLLTKRESLANAADGILTVSEQQQLLRSPKPRSLKVMDWTPAELALIDEAAAIAEPPSRLGHIVVDEAQDLTPMQLRTIARRIAMSTTVLGDLAQTTNPAGAHHWSTVLEHLNQSDGEVHELTSGYRVPAEIINFATKLLPQIAPSLSAPISFRTSSASLRFDHCSRDRLYNKVVETCLAVKQRSGSVGLIAADEAIQELEESLVLAGVPHEVLSDDGTSETEGNLTLVPASMAKGLEFDHVVVVEPCQIIEAEERGLNRLYVALTRAVTSLQVIHSEPLPAALGSHA